MIVIGKIVGSFGIRGELKIYPYTNDANMFLDLKEIYLKDKNDFLKKEITSVRKHKNMILIKFVGIENIDEGLSFINKELYLQKEDLPELDEGENYIYELKACKVYEENGNYLGVVDDVFSTGAHDVYSIIDDTGKELLLPSIPDVILSKNILNKKIIVRILPGLLD